MPENKDNFVTKSVKDYIKKEMGLDCGSLSEDEALVVMILRKVSEENRGFLLQCAINACFDEMEQN